MLEQFQQRLAAVLDRLDLSARVLYVDDGSRDATWEVIRRLQAADARIAAIRLSRNFGKELALTAALDAAEGDAVLVIDADLQDPPELIPQFVARWREGHDVVYGRRIERAGETWLKRATAAAFYRVIARLSPTRIPADTGDFRLISRRALDALKQLRERQRFMKGLFAWVGFRQTGIEFDPGERQAGASTWSLTRLVAFAVDGLASFSTVPLVIAGYIGAFLAVPSLLLGAYFVVARWCGASTSRAMPRSWLRCCCSAASSC